MRRAALLAAMATALPLASHAAEAWQGSPAYQACVKAANGVDADLGDCASKEFERNDKQLNAAYAAKLKEADAPLRDTLKTAQRAWITFRDTTCRAEGAIYSGGTLEPLVGAECEARLTGERVQWLKGLVP